jgi:two-component system response regulator YesN
MSRYHFSRTFKKVTGCNFSEFVTGLRMSRAQSLLSDTSLPVPEICRQIGYQDVSHFQRTFKNAFGISPTTYRLASSSGRVTDGE